MRDWDGIMRPTLLTRLKDRLTRGKFLLHCNYLLPRFWQFFSLGSSRKLASSWMHSELTCLLFFRQLAHAKRHSRWEFILSEANTYPTWSKWCISIFWVFIYIFYVVKQQVFVPIWKSSIDAVTGSGCRHVNVCKGAHHCFPRHPCQQPQKGHLRALTSLGWNSVRENFLYRNITRVCKCKRRSYYVRSRMCASAREDLIA